MGIWEDHKEPIYEKWKDYWYRTHPIDIAEYTWDYLFTGGKEIRARLFCELWHHLSPDSVINIELAFAMECIHVASLILDDSPWMDRAIERRGKCTLHHQFSERKALLIAHDIMRIVYEIWLTHRPPHCPEEEWVKWMRTTLEHLTIGQYYDLEKKGSLLEMASLKTGALFGAVCQTVAGCVQLDTSFWREWGIRLGVLFQWVDDWNDREEDAQKGSRNAFNEDHLFAETIYRMYWNELEFSIGSSWFDQPFGQYMKSYFTSLLTSTPAISLSLADLSAFSPTPFSFILPSTGYLYRRVEEKKKEYQITLPFETSEEMIQTLLIMIQRQEKFQPLQTDLWKIDENEWEHVPEIREWIERVQLETELSSVINK